MKRIDLTQFEKNSNFYEPLSLWVTIKSFDLQAIRKRYIKSRQNKSGKTGSVERRAISTGGVAFLNIQNGHLDTSRVLTRTKEPRGIDADGNRKFAIATEDVVHIRDGEEVFTLRHPFFSYIHTVKFSPHHNDRLLIASSGLDMIMEMNYRTQEITFEWLAWENGWQIAKDPDTGEDILLTRNEEEAKAWEKKGLRYKLISDPAGQVLPTAMRAAFINSVAYDPKDETIIYATFFHDGAVYKIHRETGRSELKMAQLKNPHGGSPVDGLFYATNTAGGELVLLQKDHQEVRYDFSALAGKPDGLAHLEWLQNSIALTNQQFLTIDSNRNQFIITDIEEGLIDSIDYDENWAVQDIIKHPSDSELESWISKM